VGDALRLAAAPTVKALVEAIEEAGQAFRHAQEQAEAAHEQALREASDVWSASYARAQTAATGDALQNMSKAGAKVSELSDAERKRWADALPQVAKIWADDVKAKGMPGYDILTAYDAALLKGGAKLPRDWNK
jgi:vacuolar-type H+-ATPase subunit H